MFKRLSILLILLLYGQAWADPSILGPDHPWATHTAGGYKRSGEDPIIYIVNTTDWDTDAVSNSTRNGVSVRVGNIRSILEEHEDSGKKGIVLFEISGVIMPASGGEFYRLNGNDHGLSVLGATAPSPGITIARIVIRTKSGTSTANNCYWSHIRFFAGDIVDSGYEDVWRGYSNGSNNTTFENCDFDTGIDVNVASGASVSNFLLYQCFVLYPLHCSLHSKGCHGKGIASSYDASPAWYIRNYVAHAMDRNPYLQQGYKLVANNYFYNFGIRACGAQYDGSSSNHIHANLINNWWQEGADTTDAADDIILWGETGISSTLSEFYVIGNRIQYNSVTYDQADASDWTHVYNIPVGTKETSIIPGANPGYTSMATNLVKDFVLKNAGARPIDRDYLATKAVTDAVNGVGTVVNQVSELGGWSILASTENTRNVESIGFPSDPHGDDDLDGYTNIEEWYRDLSDALLPGTGGLSESTEITSISTSTSKTPIAYQTFLQVGIAPYQDRPYTYLTIPAAYLNFDGIKGFCEDKDASASSTYYTFTLATAGDLYTTWDDRYSPPAWVASEGFSDTSDNIVIQGTGEQITMSIYKKTGVSAGEITLNGGGNNGILYNVFFDPTPAGGGETISSASAAAGTKVAGETITVSFTWSNNPNQADTSGGDFSWYAETGVPDLLFESSDGITWTSREIIAGMRTTDLNFKSSNIVIPSGSSLKYNGTDVNTALPASIANTTVVAAPIVNAAVPLVWANMSTLRNALGYLLPDDTIIFTGDVTESGAFTSDSGTSGHTISIDLNGHEWTVGTTDFTQEYWNITSSGSCANIVGPVTISGSHNTFSNIRFIDGVTDTGSGNSIEECTDVIPRGNYIPSGPSTSHKSGQAINIKGQ